ncbi:MAG: DUF4783 domain-containing protein [Bacteroidota bacterium]|nr:DUF4783 domain-containing protein [Bacteroidota bacterium]
MKQIIHISLILLTLIALNLKAQEVGQELNREIFNAIESGVDAGDIDRFAGYFAKQVYVSIRGGESSYFSSSQAYYIIKNFLTARKPLGFSFTTYGFADEIPFATGRALFRIKGNRESVQVYAALSKSNGKWVIDKINFY